MTEAAAFFFPAARASAGGLNAGAASAEATGRDQTFAGMIQQPAVDPASAAPAGPASMPSGQAFAVARPTSAMALAPTVMSFMSADSAISLSPPQGDALSSWLLPLGAEAVPGEIVSTEASMTGALSGDLTSNLTAWAPAPLSQLTVSPQQSLSGTSPAPATELASSHSSYPPTGAIPPPTLNGDAVQTPIDTSGRGAAALAATPADTAPAPAPAADSPDAASNSLASSSVSPSMTPAVSPASGHHGAGVSSRDPASPGARDQRGKTETGARPGAADVSEPVVAADTVLTGDGPSARATPMNAGAEGDSGDQAAGSAGPPAGSGPALNSPSDQPVAASATAVPPVISVAAPTVSAPTRQDETSISSDPAAPDLTDATGQNAPRAAGGEAPSKASASAVKTSPAEAAVGGAAAGIGPAEGRAEKVSETPAFLQNRPVPGTETAGGASGASHTAATGAPAHAQHAPVSTPAATLQVYARFIERFDGRAQRFEVRLDPAELGRIDVRIEVGSDRKVRALLAAHDSAALSDLMRGQRALERMLTEAGVDLADGGITFEMAGDQNRNPQPDDPRSGPQRPDVWRRFTPIDIPVETPVEVARRPWLPTRLDLVA